jgi:hypothetical protein
MHPENKTVTTFNAPPGQAEVEAFFAGASSSLETEQDSASATPEQLERFFTHARNEVNSAEEQNRNLASKFNVFDFITPDENRVSDILAMLLNPREAHGQRDTFLRLLIQQLESGLSLEHTMTAWAQREAPTYRISSYKRRIDILVDARDLLAIENKVKDDSERPEQVKDYLEHLSHCCKTRHAKSTLIYLTPGGIYPQSMTREVTDQEVAANRLRCWSYGRLRNWLEDCRTECRAQRFRDFLSDMIAYIECFLQTKTENEGPYGN